VKSFEYAVIRVVPRVERGEAINVGVIVYSQQNRYLRSRIELDDGRLLALDPAVDVAAVRSALSAFEKACTEGPLASQPLGERFRWLTAPRSTIVQPGPVHSGLTEDPAAELTSLFGALVRLLGLSRGVLSRGSAG
jgi:hypothetical protein